MNKDMFLERAKMLQERFPELELDNAVNMIQEAFKHEIEKPEGITLYVMNSAMAHAFNAADQLACYKAGKEMAEEYKSTKLYRLLHDR